MAYRIMLVRALLTAAYLTVGLAAIVIVDCTNAIIDLFNADLSTVCVTVGFLGRDSGLSVGMGLGGFAILGLFATWVPSLRAWLRQRRFEPTKALADNLPRLADVGTQLSEVDDVPTLTEIQFTRLVRRVEAVETSVMSETASTREVTQQWMRLLREANDLHNEGALETRHFKEINTRLLDLFVVPEEDTDDLSDASSG